MALGNKEIQTMTQKDKELLLKDLCARLPYGVKCCIYNFGENTIRIKEDRLWSVQGDNILTLKSCVEKGEAYMYHQIKPYLFPLSSMTEEQKKELRQMDAFVNTFGQICFSTYDNYGHELMPTFEDAIRVENWLKKNHFDIYGLIPKGLAIDATGLNIY